MAPDPAAIPPAPLTQGLGALFRPLNPRRAVLLALFGVAVVTFRSLLVLMVFFVAFNRPLDLLTDALERRTRARRGPVVVGVLLIALAVLAAASALGAGAALDGITVARDALPERIAAFRQTALFQALQQHVEAERLVEAARENAAHALGYLATFGHLVLQALIGFILAVVFTIEEPELRELARERDPRSLAGTFLRWVGYLADAISVTLQFQVIVAACNAVLTLPVLLVVGITHAGAFMFMVFVSGMIPVVGNFLSGAVLTLLAYQAKGWLGVALFTALTFVLHKIESYYLNPRLAARHVHLPGFVLIVSLILWEHLVGFVGLFVSFPFLYVCQRIREEFREEDGAPAPLPAPAAPPA